MKCFILEDKTHEAERLFKNLIKHRLCEPNLVTYNTMITGLCKIGDNFTAIALLWLMDARGCKPNVDTYNIIINSLCKDLMVDDAFKLFKHMIFHNSSVPPDVFTYNSLISAICKLGRLDEVSRMVKQMEAQRISLDIETSNAIVDALCKRGNIEEAEAVTDIMYENLGMHVDTTTVNSLIKGYYCLLREMTKARETYGLLGHRCGVYPNADADTYNVLLDGYLRGLNPREAFRFYRYLNGEKPKPNKVAESIFFVEDMLNTIRTLQGAYKQPQSEVEFSMEPNSMFGNTYEDALALFCFMDDNGNGLNTHTGVYDTLIEGALKCGRFDTARRLFHELTFVKGLRPGVRTYTLMITAFCRRGLLKDATKLLFELERSLGCPLKVKEAIRGYWNNDGSFDFDDEEPR